MAGRRRILAALVALSASPLHAKSALRDPVTRCDQDQTALIEQARQDAIKRIDQARESKSLDENAALEFGKDYKGRTNVHQTLRVMRNLLEQKWGPVSCTTDADPKCRKHGGYAVPEDNAIFLCPAFFKPEATAEIRARVMVHESAHVAGVLNDADKEEYYCDKYACLGACTPQKPEDNADDWAQLVNCAAGLPPDKLPVIEIRAGDKTP